MITRNTFGLGLVAALALAASAASANTLPTARLKEMMSFSAMDTNHDGMISREEYLEAAGKAFDMAAEQMKARDGKMTAAQLREFRTALPITN